MPFAPEVSLTNDRLRAIIAIPAGMAVDLHRLKELIAERGICVGLQPAALTEAAQASDQDRDLVLAIGQPPRSQWYWALRPEVGQSGESVSKSQILADRVFDEGRIAQPGLSVDGKELEVSPEEASEIVIGSGVERKGDHLVAKKDGIFLIVDDIVWRVIDDPRGQAKRDAVLFLADDAHSAWVRLEKGFYIPMDIIQALLADKGVVYGLNAEAITKAAKGVDAAETLEFARGIYPENGVDGRLEYLIDDHINYEIREDGTFDFRAAHPIQEVAKDQPLARIYPPTDGSMGMTIRGQRLDPKPGKAIDPAKYCGEGVQVIEGEIVEITAAKSGVYNKLVTGKIQVREQVVIDGDVDMKTGNVESEYPIRITGDIKEGFIVKSLCDIQVDGSIEDARVSAQGNLQVKGGILPGQHRVKAHGDIQARFIENRQIKARSVLVASSMRHCTVYSTGEVVAQEIIGGQVVAAQNINVKQAGDELEQHTILQAGVDPMQQAHVDEAVEAKKQLMPQIARKKDAVRAAVNHANTLAKKASQFTTQAVSPKHLKKVMQEGREALEESRRQRAELEELTKQLEQVEETIANYENASSKSAKCTIQVSSAVYPNVEIRIGRHARKHLSAGSGASIFRVEEGVIVA